MLLPCGGAEKGTEPSTTTELSRVGADKTAANISFALLELQITMQDYSVGNGQHESTAVHHEADQGSRWVAHAVLNIVLPSQWYRPLQVPPSSS